jgi:hypothetical protein
MNGGFGKLLGGGRILAKMCAIAGGFSAFLLMVARI